MRAGRRKNAKPVQHTGAMAAPLSARSNRAAHSAAVNMMPGGVPRCGPPKNPLLVRDDVGKAKASCYDLPVGPFAYGRPGNHDSEGAREVSMQWVNHRPSPTPESTAPDFVWFNKRAASARVTTARDLAFYRKENDSVTPRYGPDARKTVSKIIPSDVINGFTYGKKVRPSTPIDEVMSHRFAEAAEADLQKFYSAYREQQEASTQVRKIPLTTASRGHASLAKKANQAHALEREVDFKINKFKNISTKVDSRRSKAAHSALLEQLIIEGQERAASGIGQEASELGDQDRFSFTV